MLNSFYFTYSSLSKTIKATGYSLSKTTLIKHLSYLKESFFLKEICIFNHSFKNRYKAPKKTLFIDNSFLFRFSTEFSQNLGRLMKNLVGLTLYNTGKNFYYWKDYYGQEVDFVIQNQEKTEELIQVSYIKSLFEIKSREIKSLIKAKKYLKTNNLTLITWDYEGILKDKERINCIPLYRWLMKK